MRTSFRFILLAWILHSTCRTFILFCWNLSAWLLGLQPGPANTRHLISSLQPNSVRVSKDFWTSSRRHRKRRRPPKRTLRHLAMKHLRRRVLPLIARRFQVCLQHHFWQSFCPRWLFTSLAPEDTTLPQPVKPCASQLLADSRRCAPCRVTFDNSGLAELSCPNMHERILSGLASWCDNLGLLDSHVQQWVSSLQQARPACATRDPGDKVLSAVLRVAACVGFLAQSGSVSWEHIQSLNVVLEALCFWIFPPSLRSKRSTSLSTDFLFLACGALKLVLVTAWQARAGRRKRQRALKRCLGLKPAVFESFFGAVSWSSATKLAFVQFLSLQVFAGVCEQRAGAVLYQLSSPYVNYVGSTKFEVQRHRCQGSSPVNRAYQHLLEHSRHLMAPDRVPVLRKKCRLFRNVRFSDHMFWVLEQGPEPYIRTLEEASIACFQQHGNSKSIGTKQAQRARRSIASRRNRVRPRRRAAPTDVLHAHTNRLDMWRNAQRRLQAPASTLHAQARVGPQRELLYKLGFSAGYKVALQHMLLSGLGYGPVDIVRGDMSGLLARYVADAHDVCWTSLHQRLKSSCRQAGNQLDAACAVRLATRVRSMPPGSAKQRAQKRVSVHLSRFGLAKLRRICVSWPSRVPLRVFRVCVHALTCQARRNGNVRGVWFASLLQPVRTRKRTFADQWRYISVAKGFRADLAFCPLRKLVPSASDCQQMRRFKLHWTVPVWQTREDIVQQASQTVTWLARMMRCNPPLKYCERVLPSICAASVPSELYANYSMMFPRSVSTHVLVQEDKDKHAAWSMPIPVYEKWCFWMFRQDSLHWQPVHDPAQTVCEEYRQQHLRALPPHLKRFASRERWRDFSLPYAYCTLKAKCFDTGDANACAAHVCTKAGHSCFRRIISWHMHPAKHMYKGAGRAILGVIAELSVGFETTSLFSAVKDFKLAVDKLSCASDMCVRCSSPKPRLSVCVCDAAQMFEELEPCRVREAVAYLIERVQCKHPSAKGIAVARSRRLHTWIATNDFRLRSASTVWTWSDILCVLDLVLQQRVIRLGKALFRQVIGAPIGGQLSKAIASAVLAFEELKVCENFMELRVAGFVPLSANSLSDAVANTRYVDDLAMASRVLCSCCLHALTTQVYSQPIAFEPASRDSCGVLGIPWLDVWIDGVEGELRINAAGVEYGWRQSGGAGAPKKFRVIPWLGEAHADFSELRGIAAGKLVRLKCLQLKPKDLRDAVLAEIGVWALSGYPANILRRIWGHLPHFPEASRIASQAMSTWISSGLPTSIQPSWSL